MSSSKRRKLESTTAALQRRYGPHALRKGSELARPALPPHISTGFPHLDALTGCGGIPRGALSLVSGRSTSGKATLACKTLAQAQQAGGRATPLDVALVDLPHTADPDYLARCGVDLAHLLLARPPATADAVELLLDLARRRGLAAMVVHGLATLTAVRPAYVRLNALLPQLAQTVRAAGGALLFVDEPSPPWLRWLNWDRGWAVRRWAGLHIELRHERWISPAEGDFTGYAARARVLKSRWAPSGGETTVEIIFNGTVKAGPAW